MLKLELEGSVTNRASKKIGAYKLKLLRIKLFLETNLYNFFKSYGDVKREISWILPCGRVTTGRIC